MGRIKKSVKEAARSIIQWGFITTLKAVEEPDIDGDYTADDVVEAYEWICKKLGI
tara:strand:- start:240 stop:404 length:165 start_codon:yes stop_codon:yes gene_type:complete